MYTNITVIMVNLPVSIEEYSQVEFCLESGLNSSFFSSYKSKYPLCY